MESTADQLIAQPTDNAIDKIRRATEPKIGIGTMAMPADFIYRNVFAGGMPVHNKWDRFHAKHPPMSVGRWAKIFSPFDALKGFDEAISSKEETYIRRIELDEDGKRDLERAITILHGYTYNSRMAKKNRIMVTVSHFRKKAGSVKGKYIDTDGMVLSVDDIYKNITLETDKERTVIDFSDIREIRPENANLFDDVPYWCEY